MCYLDCFQLFVLWQDGWHALLYAALCGNKTGVKHLLEYDSRLLLHPSTVSLCHFSCVLSCAVDLPISRSPGCAAQSGWTALMCAVRGGYIEIIELILNNMKNVLGHMKEKNQKGQTALDIGLEEHDAATSADKKARYKRIVTLLQCVEKEPPDILPNPGAKRVNLVHAAQFALDNFLSKPYSNPTTSDCVAVFGIERHNHALAHSIRVCLYVPVVSYYFRKNLGDEYALSTEELACIQLCALFSVAGRENENSWSDNPDDYAKFRKGSASAFARYVVEIGQEHLVKKYSTLVESYLDPVVFNTHVVIARTAHNMDLMRCFPVDEMDEMVDRVSMQLNNPDDSRAMFNYSSACLLATGNRILGSHFPCPYDQVLFVSCSKCAKTCFDRIGAVELPYNAPDILDVDHTPVVASSSLPPPPPPPYVSPPPSCPPSPSLAAEGTIEVAPRSFRASVYRQLYNDPTLGASKNLFDLFATAKDFVKAYCIDIGVDTVRIATYFEELQTHFTKLPLEDEHVDAVTVAIMCLWTSSSLLENREFCSILNTVIRGDDRKLLSLAMPLIRALNQLCNSMRHNAAPPVLWPTNNVLYRGGGLPDEHKKFFTVGKMYRCAAFTATSSTQAGMLEFL